MGVFDMRVSLSRLSASKLTKVLFLASSALTAPAALSAEALAQDASNVAQPAADAPVAPDSEIIVTAQKRSESLQNVPISIQALSTRKLDQLNITSFNGYAQQLPSVTFQALGGTPGTNVVYMHLLLLKWIRSL